jgi:uncharacterized cupin superfamily protein
MTSAAAVHPILNLDALDFERRIQHGDRFDARLAAVGPRVGAKKLGYNVTKVPPGKRAFPFHCHHVNEEMFFVLEGSGVLRFGAAEHAVRKGDFVACPPGGPEVAHQFVNTGTGDLVYLAVSTRGEADAWTYPDSGKVGMQAGVDLNSGWPPKATLPARYMKDGSQAEYWDGE